MKPQSELLGLWYDALREKVGLCIETSDRVLLRQRLYRVRVEANDPALSELVILFPTDEHAIIIAKKNVPDA